MMGAFPFPLTAQWPRAQKSKVPALASFGGADGPSATAARGAGQVRATRPAWADTVIADEAVRAPSPLFLG